MTTGTWALVCLLLAANALPPDVVRMNSREFKIPINLDAGRRGEVKGLRLFISTDQGKSWHQQAEVTPDTPAFAYSAPADGLYWFTVAVVDQQGNQDPDNLYSAAVSPKVLKMLIDTARPELHIVSAERQGDEVVVKWEARDENLAADTLKLEYRTPEAPAGVWSPVPSLTPAPSGQGSFRPGSPGPVQVRMEVRDLADNTTTASTEVAAAPGTATTTAFNAPASPPPAGTTPPAFAGPGAPPPPPPSPSTFKPEAKDWQVPVRAVSQSERVDTLPSFANPGMGTTAVIANTSGGGQVAARAGGQSSADPPPGPFVGTSGPPAPPSAAGPPSSAVLPPLQIVKDRQVTLEYTVSKFGASGTGKVKLYVSRDDGRTWQLADGVPNVGSPVPTDAKGLGGPVQHTLSVTLPSEGTYGFYLVVESGAGLSLPPPQSGTLPQMRVELDTTLPEAILYTPEPEPGRRDALVLTWKATDRHLGPKPVTLEWTASPDGTWQVIGEREMENSGRCTWTLPAGVPSRVFLRLTVRDLAGNVAVAETPESILIDLNEPEVGGVHLRQAAH